MIVQPPRQQIDSRGENATFWPTLAIAPAGPHLRPARPNGSHPPFGVGQHAIEPGAIGRMGKIYTGLVAETAGEQRKIRSAPDGVYIGTILRAPRRRFAGNSVAPVWRKMLEKKAFSACGQDLAQALLNRGQGQTTHTRKGADMTDKAKILVVDDDETVRRSYSRSLSGTSCSVEAAWNGEEALRAMEKQRFDVVLLDLRMPGTDGISVLKTIKQRWPESEVVVITGYPTIETAKEAVQLGAYDYLAKPVGPAEVIHAADRALTQKKWTLHQDVSAT